MSRKFPALFQSAKIVDQPLHGWQESNHQQYSDQSGGDSATTGGGWSGPLTVFQS